MNKKDETKNEATTGGVRVERGFRPLRWLNKLYANLMGYFWLPCPVCGRFYGGHELRGIHTAALVTDDGKHAFCVCPDPACSTEAERRNIERGFPVYRAI